MITVVIPAYNAEDTIEKAVGSVLAQTEKDLEILIIDDGSTDHTASIIDDLCTKDSRIRVIHQENGGVSQARNAGIRAASGKYLMTLDDDDCIAPQMLEAMRNRMEQDRSDLVICGIRLVYPDHVKVFEAKQDDTADMPAFLCRHMARLYDEHLLTTHSNKLYDLDLIRREGIFYDPELQINEDTDFVLRYLAHCGKISLITGAYLDYYQHGEGQSLITTFRENGVSSALQLKTDLDVLYGEYVENGQLEKLMQAMDHRILVHILSCAGLMYTRSRMTDAEILNEIRKLCRSQELQELLKRVRPEDSKTRVAAFVLKHCRPEVYHRLCRLLYGRN